MGRTCGAFGHRPQAFSRAYGPRLWSEHLAALDTVVGSSLVLRALQLLAARNGRQPQLPIVQIMHRKREVNVYHSLLVHSCGLYGRPRTLRQHLPLQSVITSVGSELEPARSLLGFYNSCSYVVAGQIFSLAEIEHLARHSEELHDVSGILHVLLFYDACMASMKDLCEIILHSSLQVLRSQMQKASTRLMTLLVRAATSAWSSCMAG